LARHLGIDHNVHADIGMFSCKLLHDRERGVQAALQTADDLKETRVVLFEEASEIRFQADIRTT
jgi:hypothetical protein